MVGLVGVVAVLGVGVHLVGKSGGVEMVKAMTPGLGASAAGVQV